MQKNLQKRSEIITNPSLDSTIDFSNTSKSVPPMQNSSGSLNQTQDFTCFAKMSPNEITYDHIFQRSHMQGFPGIKRKYMAKGTKSVKPTSRGTLATIG